MTLPEKGGLPNGFGVNPELLSPEDDSWLTTASAATNGIILKLKLYKFSLNSEVVNSKFLGGNSLQNLKTFLA